MAVPVVLSPETAYVTKANIKFPGTQTAATAAEVQTKTRWEQALPSGVTVTIAGGTIKLAA
jgi:hypothetical protein